MGYSAGRAFPRTANGSGALSSVLGRIAAVIDAVAEGDSAVGVSELARRTTIPKATVSRIVASLVRMGYLERIGRSVSLGLRLFELGARAALPRDLRALAIGPLTEIRMRTGLTAKLAVLDALEVVYIDIVRARNSDRLPAHVGHRLPAHATSVGKAMLAYSTADAVDIVIARGLAAYTPNTLSDPERFRAALDRVRSTGIAISHEELETGIVCVASPVLAWGELPVAALSVSGRADDLDIAGVSRLLLAATRRLSERLPAQRFV